MYPLLGQSDARQCPTPRSPNRRSRVGERQRKERRPLHPSPLCPNRGQTQAHAHSGHEEIIHRDETHRGEDGLLRANASVPCRGRRKSHDAQWRLGRYHIIGPRFSSEDAAIGSYICRVADTCSFEHANRTVVKHDFLCQKFSNFKISAGRLDFISVGRRCTTSGISTCGERPYWPLAMQAGTSISVILSKE